MKRSKILEALKKADKPLHIKELSEKTDLPVTNLRVDLYRLQEEGEIETREKEGELLWKIKVSTPAEEKYENMTERER